MNMRSGLLRIFFLLSCFAPFFSVAAEDASGKPKLVIEEKEFDFGQVTEGTKVAHDFVIKNAGTADLVIQRVVPSCGCTAASSSTDPIAAGAEGSIHVEFDTSGFSGEKYKNVRVYTNDSENLSVVLAVRGIVESEVKVSPQAVYFDEVIRGKLGDVPSRDITVSLREGASAKITSVKAYSKNIIIKEVGATAQSRKFRVSLDPAVPIGELRDRVIIGLSGSQVSSINVPVVASVRGEFSLKPAQVSFGVVEGAKMLTRAVRFENKGSEAVVIKELKSSDPAVHVASKEIQAGKIYVLQVTVDPTKVSKDLKATVEVVTNREGEEPLELNVYGILPPKV